MKWNVSKDNKKKKKKTLPANAFSPTEQFTNWKWQDHCNQMVNYRAEQDSEVGNSRFLISQQQIRRQQA